MCVRFFSIHGSNPIATVWAVIVTTWGCVVIGDINWYVGAPKGSVYCWYPDAVALNDGAFIIQLNINVADMDAQKAFNVLDTVLTLLNIGFICSTK